MVAEGDLGLRTGPSTARGRAGPWCRGSRSPGRSACRAGGRRPRRSASRPSSPRTGSGRRRPRARSARRRRRASRSRVACAGSSFGSCLDHLRAVGDDDRPAIDWRRFRRRNASGTSTSEPGSASRGDRQGSSVDPSRFDALDVERRRLAACRRRAGKTDDDVGQRPPRSGRNGRPSRRNRRRRREGHRPVARDGRAGQHRVARRRRTGADSASVRPVSSSRVRAPGRRRAERLRASSRRRASARP